MTTLNDTYTSTGAKFYAHQEAMQKLRNGKGQPITTHVMLTDLCQHRCAFCSVATRDGDTLSFDAVQEYLRTLLRYGLKSVILSGGGNPILYKCKKSGADFNDVVDFIHALGLEIGLITNGMMLRKYEDTQADTSDGLCIRESWKTVRPETLDKLTWVRISMSGLDHEEKTVYVPDIDSEVTTLGFSYVAHDVYNEPWDNRHGQVSRPLDLISGDRDRDPDVYFEERIDWLTSQIADYVVRYRPRYVRLLPNCLEPSLIALRCKQLENMARRINFRANREVAFVQQKPPKAPQACLLGVIHPVLNCDGYVYPCDSCVLNEQAGHKFGHTWRISHWSEIANLYEGTLPESLIADPARQCPGCVFTQSNEILRGLREGMIELPVIDPPEHHNFV